MSPITNRRYLKVFDGILRRRWWCRLWLTFGGDGLKGLDHTKLMCRSSLELIELRRLALRCNPEIWVADCRTLIFSELFLPPTLHIILSILAFASLRFEYRKAVASTIQIKGETFVFTLFARGRVYFPLFRLIVMCKPVRDDRADSVLFSEPSFDKPRCPCPCLTCDTVLQKRPKPLLGECFSFTSNLIFIDKCLLTLSLVKITKISCKRFPL